MRIIIAILVIGAIGLVALDRPEKSITCLIVLLIYYVRYIWTVNKVYSLYKEGTFPMLTFEGPQNTMSVEEGKRYVRLESPTWEEVDRICFYHNCLVVGMNKNQSMGYCLCGQTIWKSAANSFGHVAECLGCQSFQHEDA